MGIIKSLLPRLGVGLVALLVTLFLFATNVPPFSLLSAQEDAAATEAVSGAAETPAPPSEPSEGVEQQTLLIVVAQPLDHTIEADPGKGGMKDGANTWTRSLNLFNSSGKPLTAYLLVQGLAACTGEVTANCVSFPSEVPVSANENVVVSFKEITLKDDAPLDGSLIVVGAGDQTELPFHITAGWEKKPFDLLETIKPWLTWLFTALVLLVVFSVLYILLYMKVYPALLPERSLPLRMNVTDDTKSLWALFSSRLRELQMMGIGGSLSNPQLPPDGIDLPTNLGKEGDIFKAVVDLLNWILPRRGISIHLQAVENKKFGKGLSVAIEKNDNNEVLTGRIFWAETYGLDPQTMDYEDLLMTPIILWVMDWWEKRYPPSGKKGRAEVKTRWDVKAYLMLASRLWSDDLPLGIKLYMDALYRDPANRQAQAGLGRVWTEYSEDDKLSEYEKRNCLELAIAYLKDVTKDDPGREDVIWFAALYNLAVAQLYLGAIDDAQQSSNRLFSQIDRYFKANGIRSGKRFKNWLVDFQSMALFFKHSAILETDPPKTAEELKKNVSAAITEIAGDPGIPPDLTNFLLVRLDYRSQYNAACYFSRCYRLARDRKWADKGQYAEVALDYLRMALGHRGGLVNLAWKDRALEPIRSDRAHKAKFKTIVPKLEKAKTEKKEEGTLVRVVMEKPLVIKNEPKGTTARSKAK